MSNANGEDRGTSTEAATKPEAAAPTSEVEENFEGKRNPPSSSTETNPTSPPTIPQSPAPTNQSGLMRQQGYYAYQQSNPPPNSPITQSIGYDSQALLLQSQLGSFGRQQFGSAPPPPLSPGLPTGNGSLGTEDANISLGVLAPSSPFPFVTASSEHVDSSRINHGSLIAPPSPSVQYISGHPPSPVVSGYAGVYGGYAGSPYPSPSIRDAENRSAWPESRQVQPQTIYQNALQSGNSPHIQSQPIPMQFQENRRTPSFDEMLPPSALEENGTYSTSGVSGAGIFSQQQSWGYNATGPYSASPQQAVQGHPQTASVHRGGAGHHARSQGTGVAGYYPATTPGPPIQTTHHNKGPDGANLFIFHIPNHFTNLDMWHLFCHYGNLLSVRIMVEKDTGRSRGFGFVSYDSPDAAAMAIKELNGFVIGNKRLKVQHKQIRPSDNNVSQQDNLQSPPLFPPMTNVHTVPTTDVTAGNNSEVRNMMGNWLGTHEAPETVNSNQKQTEVDTLIGTQGQSGLQPTEDEGIDPQNDGKSNLNFDDGAAQNVGPALGNLDQIRDTLPSISKQI